MRGGSSDDQKKIEHKKLDALVRFCEAATCRRQILLKYFGDACEPCGNCDTCEPKSALRRKAGYQAAKAGPRGPFFAVGFGGGDDYRETRDAPKRRFGTSADDDGGEADAALLAALKALRSALAKQHGVPSYVIFHDRTLIELATKKPMRIEDLSGISGIGDKKLQLYGREIIDMIEEFR